MSQETVRGSQLVVHFDGPLHVTGNLEIVSGTGRTVNRVTDCWLCRCGQSKDKPYCDGSHQQLGHWT